MKKLINIIVLLVFISTNKQGIAQDTTTAIGYMQLVTNQQQYMMQKSWNYMHTVAHSFDVDQIAKAQKELIRSVEKSLDKIQAMPDFKGKTAYKDAAVEYLKNNLKVYRKEYKEMIDLQKVTLSSYNALENYLQLKELANQKLDGYFMNFKNAHKAFADQNGITLLNHNTDLSKKIKKSVEVIQYKDQLHLDFFESYIAEIDLVASCKHEDASLLKQNNKKLKTAISSGKKKLANRSSYKNDDQLIKTAQNIFDFYQEETEKYIPELIHYYQTKEKFAILEKKMEETPQNKLTQKMVDEYNKSVKEINTASKKFNKTQKKLNDLRSTIILNWNVVALSFLDTHIPKEDS